MPLPIYSAKTNEILQSKDCSYYTFDNIGEASFLSQLIPHLPHKCDILPERTRLEQAVIFDGFWWTRWTSEHWNIPVVACVVYLIMVFFLPKIMAAKEKMRLQPVVIVWNFGLSFFSFCGLIYCVPHLLWGEEAGLLTQGYHASVCSHASTYGFGKVGFFVYLFIYSKLAELLDTLWLLLRKSPVILLHWYHHVTVLLYCWHAYSVRIGTGLWFAAMNYTVHAIMYFYFGLTQCGDGGRKFAKKFAMIITTMQLTQMVIGIVVTVSSVVYHAYGATCYVSLFNSALGLVMYSSYFVLFLQLFLNHYVFNKKIVKKSLPSDVCPPSDEIARAADAANKAKSLSAAKAGKKI